MDVKSIEVRAGWKAYYLICFGIWVGTLLLSFIIPKQRQDFIDFFFHNWNLRKALFMPLVFFLPALCLFSYFDRKLKVRIDSDGIWSKKKGRISWNDISNFYSTVNKNRSGGDKYRLHIRLIDTENRLDQEVILKFWRVDKSFDEIRSVVEYYADKHKIEDLGHEKEE